MSDESAWPKVVVPGSENGQAAAARLRGVLVEPSAALGAVDLNAAAWSRILRKRESEPWPTLDPAALYGLAGRVVEVLRPHTESDPAALLVDFLTSFGSAVGPASYALADGAEHPARLNVLLVGDTARARKGTSRANVRRIMAVADPDWSADCDGGGLASGEGLIAKLADGTTEDGEPVPSDRRLLVFEPEFARLLGVAARENNTVSAVVRDAWDSGRMRVLTRKDPLVATGAHVSIIGHITRDELARTLSGTEIANGFANRFLFVLVRRSKLLPLGGDLDSQAVTELGRTVGRSLSAARQVGRMRRTLEADREWSRLYARIAESDCGGLVGSITARAEAQLLRLSVVFALTDGSRSINVEHLLAADAVWRYADSSARVLFGSSTGDAVADRLLTAIRNAGADGLSFEQQRGVSSGHVNRERLSIARAALEQRGLIETVSVPTSGRPRQVSRAVQRAESSVSTERTI